MLLPNVSVYLYKKSRRKVFEPRWHQPCAGISGENGSGKRREPALAALGWAGDRDTLGGNGEYENT